MQIVPRLDMITMGTIMIKGKRYPVVDIEVVPSEFSNPEDLFFDWVTSSMTERSIRFKLSFKTARFVSAKETPDILKVTFRDRYMFLGVNDLAISNGQDSRRDLADGDLDEAKLFVTIHRALP